MLEAEHEDTYKGDDFSSSEPTTGVNALRRPDLSPTRTKNNASRTPLSTSKVTNSYFYTGTFIPAGGMGRKRKPRRAKTPLLPLRDIPASRWRREVSNYASNTQFRSAKLMLAYPSPTYRITGLPTARSWPVFSCAHRISGMGRGCAGTGGPTSALYALARQQQCHALASAAAHLPLVRERRAGRGGERNPHVPATQDRWPAGTRAGGGSVSRLEFHPRWASDGRHRPS